MVVILSDALLVSTLVRESPVTLLQHPFSSLGFYTEHLRGTNLKCLPSSQLDMTPSSRQLVQFSSVAQSCLTLCNTMNHSTSGLPVHHQLPEFTQTHVHWVNDAIQPSHPLLSPSPLALKLSQHEGLFQSGSQSIGAAASASVLPMNIQDWFPLGQTGWISLLFKGLSRVFSNTTVQKH